MPSQSLPIILASGSPRRKELLSQMGLEYTVDVSEADESFCGPAGDMVLELSRRKARSVAVRHPAAIVIAADTTVCDADGEILGKPGTPERAADMLRALSGRWHSVFTGVTVINTLTGQEERCAVETRVHFVPMSEEDIAFYVATKEPIDKAGAYGIQGTGGVFIDRIEGSYSNVVGLPTAQLRALLARVR